MRRARTNIATLVPRLQTLGYQFAHPEYAHRPPAPDAPALVGELVRCVGPIPLSLRAWYEIVRAALFIGNHPTLAFFQDPRTGPSPSQLSDPLAMPGIEEALEEHDDFGPRGETGPAGSGSPWGRMSTIRRPLAALLTK